MFNNGNAHDLNGGIIRQIGNGPIIDIYNNGYELRNISRDYGNIEDLTFLTIS